MIDCPEEIKFIEVLAVSALPQNLRRYTLLNCLDEAALAVLQNSSKIDRMLDDLNPVEFRSIQEQASSVCQCDGATTRSALQRTLYQQNSLDLLAT
jgi:regulatory factor X 1/2/3